MTRLGPHYFLDLFEKKIITREQCAERIKSIKTSLQHQLFEIETVLAMLQTADLFEYDRFKNEETKLGESIKNGLQEAINRMQREDEAK